MRIMTFRQFAAALTYSRLHSRWTYIMLISETRRHTMKTAEKIAGNFTGASRRRGKEGKGTLTGSESRDGRQRTRASFPFLKLLSDYSYFLP